MELFIGSKIQLTGEYTQAMQHLDLDLEELLNAVIADMRVFEKDVYSSLVERSISRVCNYHTPNHDVMELRAAMDDIEFIIQHWLFFKNPFDILCYFYCRSFRRIENSTDPYHSIYHLELDALYDEMYRNSADHIRESLHGFRLGFINRRRDGGRNTCSELIGSNITRVSQ